MRWMMDLGGCSKFCSPILETKYMEGCYVQLLLAQVATKLWLLRTGMIQLYNIYSSFTF